MEIDDNDFYVVRKNLNILSVLILILAFLNARLQTFNFLNIQLELNGDKLYIAMFIGYVYFIWRFCTKLPLKSGFWNDFIQYYLDSENGVKSVHNEVKYRQHFIDKSKRIKRAIVSNDDVFRLIQLSVVRFKEWPNTKLRLSATFTSTGDDKNDYPNFNVDHDIHVSRFFFVTKLIFFCISSDKFGDYLFPFVLILSTFIFFFLKPTWQGNFYSLFWS